MASKSNPLAHQSGDTSEDILDKILETLPELEKLISSVKKCPLERSEKEGEITEIDNEKVSIPRSVSAPPALTHVAFDGKLMLRLKHHFRHLKLKLGKLDQFQTYVGVELDKHLVALRSLITNLDSPSVSSQTTYWIKSDLEDIEKKISDLLYQVPLLSGRSEKQIATAYGDEDDEDEVHHDNVYYLRGLHTNVERLIKCEAFRQVKRNFMELEAERKICLLSFAVFPENREVHRTVLMYWWIGEGILNVKTAEEDVRKILKDFTEKKLVEPVEERRKLAPSSYKMSPFVHSSVVLISKEIGLFDIYGEESKPRMNMSDMGKVFLVEGSAIQPEATSRKMPSLKIETVLNVSERYPDFAVRWFLKNPRKHRRFTINSSEDWFKSLKVFYLGRWERSQKRHIEVQNHELMKCLKHVTKVRLLSLQGISTIRSLNNSVCKLRELVILDLRECYDLTKLPDEIDSLENLVYLDMTGCYMLEWIPSRLAYLDNLEVLKGFVVSDDIYDGGSCKLIYLKHLRKLRKLSIEINRDDFRLHELMEDLADLKSLTSLKVTWRRDLDFYDGGSSKLIYLTRTVTRSLPKNLRRQVRVPFQLKKLSLQRFPEEELPTWLHPHNLLHLKKLHIGGGRTLKGFGDLPEEATPCAVEVLRLTSLPKLTVGWIELKQLYFPNLIFLENYECPRVTLTPCDGNGIWRSDQDCSTITE
ncbi:disease resistance RPP13-like protein 4 isoform X2 [Eutrema salsugineum]|nr:disease resistance RPP13-like protein 4 isoform X2 [Eutrema salsugineum]